MSLTRDVRAFSRGESRADPGPRGTAEILLDRLTVTLGLETVCERGELLRLASEDAAEFEIRGERGSAHETGRSLYCIVPPGWRLDGFLLVRPLLEAISGVRG